MADDGVAVFADALCRVIGRARGALVFTTEAQMQAAMAALFAAEGIDAESQVALGPGERPDFMIGAPGVRIAVELKRAGTPDALARQVRRYARYDQVKAIVVITNRVRHRDIPREIDGKPVRVVCLAGVTAWR